MCIIIAFIAATIVVIILIVVVDDGVIMDGVMVYYEEVFPYIDMELFWCNNDLIFKVHLKTNQQIKYLNQGSAHRLEIV